MSTSAQPFRSHLGLTVTATALAVVLFVVRWFPQPDPDTGLNLTAAWQITQGLAPYRDFFEFHTPGAFYLLAGVFWLFGPSYVAAKLVSVLLTLVTGVLLDRLCLLFTRSGWHRVAVQAVWIALQMQFPLISYNNYAHLASIWAAYALVQAWRKRAFARFFGLGVAVAGVAWFLQQRGLAVLLVGLGVTVMARQRHAISAYLGGACLSLLPLLAWPLPVLWQHLVAYPLAYYPEANVVHPKWLLAALGVALASAAAAMVFCVRASGFWPLWWLSITMLLTTWARADLVYLPMVLWPVPVLLVTIAAARYHAPVRSQFQKIFFASWNIFQAGLGMVALGLTVLSFSAFFTVRQLDFPHDPFGLRVPYWEQLAVEVRQRTAPTEPILATPTLPSLYFFAQRPAAIRFNSLFSSQFSADYFDAAVADLERSRPRIVVRDYHSLAVQLGFHRDGTIVDQYLDAHYRVVRRLPGAAGSTVQILERFPNPP